MRKILLLVGLFILRSSCIDEVEWNNMLTTEGPDEPTPCGPNMVCVPYSQCINGTINKYADGVLWPRTSGCDNGTTCCSLGDLPVPEYQSCGENKKCVPPSLCTSGTVNKDGAWLISARSNDCENILQCCPVDDVGAKNISEMPQVQPGCGYRNPNGVLLKVNSPKDETEFGEFPWTVAIYVNENTYHCAGSLLHPKVVLTVGHRVYDKQPKNLKVRAGEWERNSENEPILHQDRRVQLVIVHYDFRRRSQENNIALLIVKKSFDLSPHINTVCLPPAHFSAGNANCFVTGWGAKTFNTKKYADIMKKIEMKVVPTSTCESNIRKTRMGPRFTVKPSQICAGGEDGADACTGDGGSALVCPIPNTDNRYYEVGLVSGGVGCGQRNVPGVYANIAHLLPWIENEFRAKNFNFTFLP